MTPSQSIDKIIARHDDWRGQKMAEIRRIIRDTVPDVTEELKWMGTPTWSRNGILCICNPFKDMVKVTFISGAQLGLDQLFNAELEGSKWRALKIFPGDKLNDKSLKQILLAAVAFNSGRAMKKRAGKSNKVALLSGGNPQIAKGDGDAPVKAYIAAVPGWKQDVSRRLDALIARTVPNVRKAVKWNSPFYGIDGQGWFLSFHCFTNYLKVGFFRGASLRPPLPGTSKQKDMRYLDIHEDDELDEKRVASWIRQAAALPGWIP